MLVARLTVLLDPIRVLTELPATLDGVLPVVQVARIGGPVGQLGLDAPNVDVDCYAATRIDARNLAYRVNGLVLGLRNSASTDGVVFAARSDNGPAWRPYDNLGLRRFGASYTLSIRA